jgi:hypothetical protein
VSSDGASEGSGAVEKSESIRRQKLKTQEEKHKITKESDKSQSSQSSQKAKLNVDEKTLQSRAKNRNI